MNDKIITILAAVVFVFIIHASFKHASNLQPYPESNAMSVEEVNIILLDTISDQQKTIKEMQLVIDLINVDYTFPEQPTE